MCSSLSSVLVFCVLLNTVYSNTQSTKVEGTLTCEGKPAKGITVKLYDDGTVYDSSMGSTKTDANGFYSIAGTSTGITTIDPKINIYHDCNDGIKPCQRKFTIFVPKSSISQSSIPTKTYNAGTMELAGKLKGETRDCIH